MKSIKGHKETREQRERRQRRLEFRMDARDVGRDLELDGYVVVAWQKDGTSIARWHSGDLIPGTLVGEMAKRVVERTILGMDMTEWLP